MALRETLLVACVVVAVHANCEPYCAEVACSDLNGDVSHECGDCSGTEKCRPGAPGFDSDSLDLCEVVSHYGSCPRGRWGQSTHLYRTRPYVRSTAYSPARNCSDPVEFSALRADCSDPESLQRLPERGWVVIRGLAPPEELATIGDRTPVKTLCQPLATETAEGRAKCAFSSRSFRDRLPKLSAAIDTMLSEWQSRGVAEAAELGSGLRLAREHPRLSRLIQITSLPTFNDVQRGGAQGVRYAADWHVDNQGSLGTNNAHWIFVAVRKDTEDDSISVRDHANLCMVPTSALDECDGPAARIDALVKPARWMKIWDRLGCCPSLEPGDAVFYASCIVVFEAIRETHHARGRFRTDAPLSRDLSEQREDVAHKTQDEAIDRLGMVIKIEADEPRRTVGEDVQCPTWAAAGDCDAHPEFMECVCPDACASAAAGGGETVGGQTRSGAGMSKPVRQRRREEL